MGSDSTNAPCVARATPRSARSTAAVIIIIDGGRGFGLGESGTDANGARRRSPAQEAIMMITVSYIRTS